MWVNLSDTHGAHGRLGAMPPANVLVHSGDISLRGTEKEVLELSEKMQGAQGEMMPIQWNRYIKITNKLTQAAQEMIN